LLALGKTGEGVQETKQNGVSGPLGFGQQSQATNEIPKYYILPSSGIVSPAVRCVGL